MAKFIQVQDKTWTNIEMVTDVAIMKPLDGVARVLLFLAATDADGDQISTEAGGKYAEAITAELHAGTFGTGAQA